MTKRTLLFKQSINKILDLIQQLPEGDNVLYNDIELTKMLSISRTTVRGCIDYLIQGGIIKRVGANKIVLRPVTSADYFGVDEGASSKDELFERYFLNLIYNQKLLPGDKFSELGLAKDSGYTTITVREFLIRFSANGLIKKIPRGRWQMIEFDEKFAAELGVFREMVEMKALTMLMSVDSSDSIWLQFEDLLRRHLQVQHKFEQRYTEVPDLDRELHLLIQQGMDNRFSRQFFDIVSFVFHYHYQWDKQGEKERFQVALSEHILLLNALLSGDLAGAIKALSGHLQTAQQTLLHCIRSAHR